MVLNEWEKESRKILYIEDTEMHTNIARKTLIEMESKMYVKHVGN
jgi:hypothetical protein